jgi:hypothetical protein
MKGMDDESAVGSAAANRALCDRGAEVDLRRSPKLTDRLGILPYKSVVEWVQFANWDWSARCNIVWTPVFGRDLRRAFGDTRICD